MSRPQESQEGTRGSRTEGLDHQEKQWCNGKRWLIGGKYPNELKLSSLKLAILP